MVIRTEEPDFENSQSSCSSQIRRNCSAVDLPTPPVKFLLGASENSHAIRIGFLPKSQHSRLSERRVT